MTVIRSRYQKISSDGISFNPDDPRNVGIDCVSQTQQQFKDDCDLKVILKRYRETGLVDVPLHDMQYGDFSNVADFQQAQELVARVGEYFDQLPSHVRREFNNSPSEFVAFVNDPNNSQRAKDLGLGKFFGISELDSEKGSTVVSGDQSKVSEGSDHSSTAANS